MLQTDDVTVCVCYLIVIETAVLRQYMSPDRSRRRHRHMEQKLVAHQLVSVYIFV